MNKNGIVPFVFAAFFVLLIYLMWLMIKPLLGPLIFAGIIGGAFYPVFNKIRRKLKRRRLSAVICCLLITVIVFLPCIYLLINLSKEAVNLYLSIKIALNEQAVHHFLFGDGTLAQFIKKAADFFNIELNLAVIKEQFVLLMKDFSGHLLGTLNSWVGNIITFLFDFVVMLLFIFALFTEGERLRRYMLKLSPLPDEQEELIIRKFNQMNYVTLVCNGVGAIIQGFLAGVAFWFAGIGSVILWTAIMTLLAFIPLLGISIIYVPACLYLLITGKLLVGILLFIYCSAVALITENWFKPIFMGKRIQMNSLFVLFCIIGGMAVFDIAGIFYGPVIGIIFLTTVEIYQQHYS